MVAILAAPAALAHGVSKTLGFAPAAGGPVAPTAVVPLPTPDGHVVAMQEAPQGIDPSGLLPDLPWETVNRVRVTSGTPWIPLVVDGTPVDQDDGLPVRGTIEFWCPNVDGQTAVQDGTNTLTMRATCPYRIIDDADLMGSPQLAVKQSDPNSMAFFSLHGAGSTEGPSPRSRDPSPDGVNTLTGQSHTTFTSPDMGRDWFDNPHGSDGFGEHASGAMDKDGNLYISFLWSKRLGNDEFDYVIKVYKEQDGRFEIGNYQPSKTFPNRAAGNRIEEANMVYVPAATLFPTDNATDGNSTGNATGPADDGDIGNSTQGSSAGLHNSPDDRVVVLWHERARDIANATTGKSSWIDAAWSDTSSADNWTRLAPDQLIGPCMAASNPVQWNGKAYIACVADAGYGARSRAHIGDIDVWSIDPRTGLTTLEGISHLVGGTPRLAARDDGRMAMTTTRVLSEDEVQVQLEYGWYGRHWDVARNYGPELHRLASNTLVSNGAIPPSAPRPPPASNSVREARITALAMTNQEDTVFLTYMERLNVGDVQDPNPNNPFISPDSVIEYKKLVATFTPCTGPDNVFDLQVGTQRHPFAEAIVGNQTGVFDDLQDGMQTWTDPGDGGQRVYFVYGDHGVIQYGALVATSSPSALSLNCVSPPPAPFLPTAAIPSALSATSPASMLVGATVGLTAASMATYLLAVRRKSANALATKAKK